MELERSDCQAHVALYGAGGDEALTSHKRGPKVPANLSSAEIEGEIVARTRFLSLPGCLVAWSPGQPIGPTHSSRTA